MRGIPRIPALTNERYVALLKTLRRWSQQYPQGMRVSQL